jgi:catechol 2,3-dioxygenase-like lactoylglutathione lyase family enzyme
MSLHRLQAIRIGVSDPTAQAAFYGEMGLTSNNGSLFDSPDGGTQIHVSEAPFRRLLGVDLGVDSEADLADIAGRLTAFGASHTLISNELVCVEPHTHIEFRIRPLPRLEQSIPEAFAPNAPGSWPRRNRRSPGVFPGARSPRRLGHIVVGTPSWRGTRDFLIDALGFKVSDEFTDIIAFLRCTTDHHNIAIVGGEVPFLQHYSWECDDVDHVGHLATKLLAVDEGRHTWGFGRHFIGSNFMWYLRDPSGSFVEFYSDMDRIDDDAEWESVGRTAVGLENVGLAWGPRMPMEFIVPKDIDVLKSGWASLER